MKIIVTGGAGFIGSNLVDRLVADDHDVIVIDNESSDAHESFFYNDSAEYFKYDVADFDSIEPLFKDVDYVFHLAAEARIMNTIEDPTLAVKTNVLGTANVLQAALENGVKRVIYSSTSAAYGLENDIPNKETMPRDCLNPYSVTKCSGEDLCEMYTFLFGLETITFRYFNVYGNRQPRRGQYAPVMGIFQRQVEAGEPMTIVGDGLQKRDYVNVLDVVEANVRAAFVNNDFALGQVFNIGSGTNYNIHDLVKMIGGPDARYIHLPPRQGEARETLADCSKAKALLKWEPKIALEEWMGEKV
jgi:UDP-glucose 4-epimerase